MEKELIGAFIKMTAWLKTRKQSNHMYKEHRHIDMKSVLTDIYKQNSSGRSHGQWFASRVRFSPAGIR